MAEVSAKLRIEADTAVAKRNVKELGGDLEKVKEAAGRAQKASSGGGAVGTGGGDGVREMAQRLILERYKASLGNYKGEYRRKDGEIAGTNPEDIGRRIAREFARIAGSAMAKFIVGYITNEGVSTAFQLMRRPGKDSSGVEQAEGSAKGALEWGAAGAQMAGPWGGIIGGILGGVKGFIMAEREASNAYKEFANSRHMQKKSTKWQIGKTQEDMVFDFMYGNQSEEGKVEMLQERAAALKGSGEGARKYIHRLRHGTREESAEIQLDVREAMEAELHNNGMLEDGRKASIGGNEAGTQRYYEILWRASKLLRTRGSLDYSKYTDLLKERMDYAEGKVNNENAQELGVYIGQLQRLRGIAGGMSAITDSASAKGLGVGAQIGTVQSEKMLKGIDRVSRMIQMEGDKAVEAIRSLGGINTAVARAM